MKYLHSFFETVEQRFIQIEDTVIGSNKSQCNRQNQEPEFWFNKHIKIDNKSLCNNSLADQGINHVGQRFKENGMTKAWLDIKTQFNLSNKQHYFGIQLINS